MGFFQDPAKGLSNFGQAITGNSKNAGMLGLGQYKASVYNPNEAAFTDQTKSQGIADSFAGQLAQSQARQAPQLGPAQQASAANIDQSQQGQFRNDQQALAAQLQAQSLGQGPSVAGMQLQQATDRNLAQQLAMAASSGRGNPALAQRNAAMNTANIGQQAAMQAAQTRAQEQMNAQGQLGNVLQQGRGQDIGLATSQADLSQQATLANQAAANQFALQQAQMQQQQQAQNDAMARYYNTGIADQATQGQQNAMALEQLKSNNSLGIQGIDQKGYQGASQARGDFIGNLGKALGVGGSSGPGAGGASGAGAAAAGAEGGVMSRRGSFVKMAGGGVIDDGTGGKSGFRAAVARALSPPVLPSSDPERAHEGEKEMGTAVGKSAKSLFSSSPDTSAQETPSGGITPLSLPAEGPSPTASSPMSSFQPFGPQMEACGGVIKGYAEGAIVPGKAEVEGNSYANDKVPALLSPGEAVVPRDAMESPKKLDSFFTALKEYQKKNNLKESSDPSENYLQASGMLHDRMSDLEKAFKSRSRRA